MEDFDYKLYIALTTDSTLSLSSLRKMLVRKPFLSYVILFSVFLSLEKIIRVFQMKLSYWTSTN